MTAFVQNGMLTIENYESANDKVNLYNTSGQLLITKTNMPQKCSISLQSYPRGIYILEVTSGNENYKLKVNL
jgi:hypothetical protein